MKKSRVRITDHAMIRFLERVGGVDVEGLRLALARSMEEAGRLGAAAVVIDGYRYVLREDEAGPYLITVEPFAQTAPIYRNAHQRHRPSRDDEE